MRVGSVYTRVAAGASADQLVESGQTITVYLIACANTSASAETVTIEEANTSTVIQTIQAAANATTQLQFPTGQLFHKGLQVTANTNTSVTVYHSHGGN